jgi:hypothetical protein
MGDMVATDVTVTLDPREADFFAMATKVTFPTIAFGASSGKAYPTGGIPMPAMGAFGMKKEIKRIFVSPRAADGIIWKYDKVNHKLMAYVVGGTVTGTISSNSAGTPSGNSAAPTGNLAQANVAVGALTGNLANGTVAANAVSNLVIGTDAIAGTANGANVANRALTLAAGAFTGDVMANHSHVFSAGDVTDAALAEYANTDMLAKTLDLMVIGS